MTQADEVDCYGGLQRMVKERLMAMVAYLLRSCPRYVVVYKGDGD